MEKVLRLYADYQREIAVAAHAGKADRAQSVAQAARENPRSLRGRRWLPVIAERMHQDAGDESDAELNPEAARGTVPHSTTGNVVGKKVAACCIL